MKRYRPLKYAELVVFFLVIGASHESFSQDRVERVGDKIYQQINENWFYLKEVADTVRISPDRLIVRLIESVEDIAHIKHNLQMSDFQIYAGPTHGGYYILQAPSSSQGFVLKRLLNDHKDIESVMFSELGEVTKRCSGETI